jgi:hypothetical protein
MLVVRRDIHFSSGKLKKIKQALMDLSRQDTDEGIVSFHFFLNCSKNFIALFFEEA